MAHRADEANVIGRMQIPHSGSTIVLSIGYVLLTASVVLAALNLTRFSSTPLVSLGASILWLLLMALCVRSAIHDAGNVRQFIINRIGDFAHRRFVDAVSCPGDLPMVRFGYDLAGRHFCFLDIRSNSIISIAWHAGRASSMTGRDMNDWSVVLWYRNDRSLSEHIPNQKRKDLYIVGPSRARSTTDAFGRSFIAFLQSVGIHLESTTNPCKFVRHRLTAPPSPPPASAPHTPIPPPESASL